MINCLTFEQLELYSFKKLSPAESSEIYLHISSCELCACAVNGFAALPFSADEIVAINREIDMKVNGKAAFPLTLAQVLLIVLSLACIGLVYNVPRFITRSSLASLHNSGNSNLIQHEPQKIMAREIPVVIAAHRTKKKLGPLSDMQTVRHEMPESLQPVGIKALPVTTQRDEEVVISPCFNSEVIYIYDLKVTDYSNLYFRSPELNVFKTHVPPSNENRGVSEPVIGPAIRPVAADRVLKQGLAAFDRGNFRQAASKFELLLSANNGDVNAQFYSSLCYYFTGNSAKSIDGFRKVLESENNVFYPEAKWYLANALMKSGDNSEAKQLLETIASEHGFYARQAREKLVLLAN